MRYIVGFTNKIPEDGMVSVGNMDLAVFEPWHGGVDGDIGLLIACMPPAS